MIVRALALAILAAALPGLAQAQEFDPSDVDLAGMIGCSMDARDYNGFAMWFATEPDAARQLGWTPVAQDNPFLSQFALPAPIPVFGHAADNVAFTGTGPLAMLPGLDPGELAAALGLVPVHGATGRFLAEKVLVSNVEEVGGTRVETTVSLNVSTVDTHPGVTLAGCSYRVEVK